MYRFVLGLVPTVEKFPRRQKFLLADRLQMSRRRRSGRPFCAQRPPLTALVPAPFLGHPITPFMPPTS